MKFEAGFKVWLIKYPGIIAMILAMCVQYAFAQTPPSFTSTQITDGTYQAVYNYSITTTDPQAMAVQISLGGTLPDGLSFIDNGDGTALISGTATAAGSFPVVLTVTEVADPTQNGTQSFTITIAKAPLMATADDQSRGYGQSDPIYTITYSGFLGTDNASSISPPTASSAPSSAGVGSYPIVVSGGSAANYSLSYSSGNLTVTPAPLIATADDKSKVYGQSNPVFTISYSGFVNGDNAGSITPPTATTVAGSPAGSYPITLSGTTANYQYTFQSGILSVTKASLIASADNQTKVYGQVNPALTISYNGFVNGDDVTAITPPVASTASASSVVGSYPITLSGTTSNYDFTFQQGTLSVTKAALTASADNQTKVYGQVNPTFTISYSGFVNGDTPVSITAPVAITPATTSSGVGAYSITLGGTTPNYDFSFQPGTLTVTPATLTAKAADAARLYGQSNPSFTISYTGFAGTDNVSSITPPVPGTAVISSSPVGSYPITLSGGSAANYSLILQPGTLTIGQATLTARADDQTRAYGAIDPTFTITYTGFLNGENASVITPPAAATTAGTSSNVGSYPITLSGGTGGNYSLVLQSGNLTITKATPVVSWTPPAAITFGTPLSATQLNATASVAGNFNYAPAAGTTLNAGSNQILSVSFTPTDLTNYATVLSTTVQITVSKANPIITWANPAPIVFGTALSGTQLNATSSVGGSFTYSPASGAVLNAAANQILSVNFVPTDAANYNTITGTTVLINVSQKVPVVTWGNPAPISYGVPLSGTQLNATASVAGNFSYAPGSGTVLNAGANQALSVNFTPTDPNYSSVNGTQVLITVAKSIPVLNWANPASIVYGTALSTVQLNASTPVPGTYAYSPDIGTVLNAGVGQTLSVTFTPNDPANYTSGSSATVTITVNKATPPITWNAPASITYGTPLSATQLNATSSAIGGGTFVYSPATATTLNAGAGQTLSVTFTPSASNNYSTGNASVLITVDKAVPVVTWATPGNINYGTPLSSTQLNATASVPGAFAYSPASGSVLNAGANQNITAIFTPGDAANYSSVSGIVRQITVLKATPSISWTPPLPIKVGVALSSAQLNATSPVSGSFSYNPPAGTVLPEGANQPLSATFTPADASNYVVASASVTITVSAKDNPVITWNNPAPFTYGAALSATQLNATSNVPGSFSYSPAIGTVLNAGKAKVLTATFAPTDNVNYNTVNTIVHLDVNKAVLGATASNASRTYGAPNPAFTITYAGFVNGDTPAVIDTVSVATCNATAGTPVGSAFSIIPSGGGDNNYTFNYINGTLTITKATLTAKADDKSRSYGVANPAFTISYSGFLNGDNVGSITPATATTTATVTSIVNTYPITVSGGSASNYSLVYQSGILTINAVPLTVTADHKSRGYGQANPALSITYIGFLNGDNATSITPPSISTTATTLSAVGNYPITLSGGTAVNYVLILQNGTLTIGKIPLTVKADDKSKIYGQPNPGNSLTYTGFINGDNASVITSPVISGPATTTTSGVGFYPITLSGGSATNYDLALQNGGLTITPAPLHVTIDDATRGYGLPNPAFTFSFAPADFVNGEDASSISTPSVGTAATTTSNVGTYPVTLSGTTANYQFVVKNGTLTITPATLSAKANDANKTYGSLNPVFTIQFNGFVNGDTPASSISAAPALSSPATAASDAGSYPINPSGGTSLNYMFSYVAGTLTVNKATLNAKANNQQRLYGTPNPVFTATYSTFLNGDTPAALDMPPTFTTDATDSSPVGNYVISVSGASDNNYNFTYTGGILSIVNSAAPVLQDYPVTTDEDTPFTFSYAGFYQHFASSPGDSIVSIRIVTTPANGVLMLGSTQLSAGSVIPAAHGVIGNFRYVPGNNFNGTDSFDWNASDGPQSAPVAAAVTILVTPVDDAPVLSNIEKDPLPYELGDPAEAVTTTLIIDDIDNNFLDHATVRVAQDFSAGDKLSLNPNAGVSPAIVTKFDASTGTLSLKGKESKSNYEKALNSVLFESPISSGSALVNKTISFVVNDSIADSNTESRIISITKVFPELSLVNAFTPNDDNVNDYWDFLGLDNYTVINIAVFDQNGFRVFECTTADCKWDGKVKGKELPAGPYFYSIDLDKGKRKYTGTVTILK